MWRWLTILLLSGASCAAFAAAHPAPPQSTAPAPSDTYQLRFRQGPDWAPLPIELINNNVVFEAQINGQPATVLLDNGTGKTLVDRGFARRAGIGLSGAGGDALVGRSALPTQRTDIVMLDLPHALTVRGSLLALDLTPMTKASGRPIDVVLGGDILDVLAVMIQPEKKQLSLVPSGAITIKGPNTVTFPIVDGNKADAVIKGQTVRLEIDLGYSGVVRLTDAAWRRVFPAGYPSRPDTFTRTDGSVTVARTANADVSIGTLHGRDAPISDGYVSATSSDGLLGAGFLLQETSVLDAQQKQVTMIPYLDKQTK